MFSNAPLQCLLRIGGKIDILGKNWDQGKTPYTIYPHKTWKNVVIVLVVERQHGCKVEKHHFINSNVMSSAISSYLRTLAPEWTCNYTSIHTSPKYMTNTHYSPHCLVPTSYSTMSCKKILTEQWTQYSYKLHYIVLLETIFFAPFFLLNTHLT